MIPVTGSTAASPGDGLRVLPMIPDGFTPRVVIDRRKECRALTQRASDVTPAVWVSGNVDFFFDPRRGEPPAMPEEACVELEVSGDLPGHPSPALLLGDHLLGELPDALLGGGTIRIALPASALLPGINRIRVTREPPDPRISRRLTRLTLHTRGARPAGDLHHYFLPGSGEPPPAPPKPPAWEKMMAAKQEGVHDLLINLCTQALTADPANAWTRWTLACGLDRLDQPAEALPSYARATEVAAHEVWILSDLGRCLTKLERYDEAELFLETAVERAQARNNLACVYWSSRNMAEIARLRGDTARMRAMSRRAEEAMRLDEGVGGVRAKEELRAVAEFLEAK